MTKGPLELRRTFPGFGVLRVSSGTHKRTTLHALETMCRSLYEAGRLDYLRVLADRAVTPLEMYDRLRGANFQNLPPPIRETLAAGVERFLTIADVTPGHRKNLKSYLKRIVAQAPERATGEDVPAAVRKLRPKFEKEEQGAAFNRLRAAALAYLFDTLGPSSPAYLATARIGKMTEYAKREPMPLSPVEAFDVARKLGDDLGACWLTLCFTGMGRSEYEGHWQIENGHLHVYGTKRAARNRLVPLAIEPVRPICSARFLHERIMEVTEGRVQLYDARRTFTRWLEQAGILPAFQDAYTGHGSASQTDRYKRGNTKPYLDDDAERIRAFIRRALSDAGLDAGQALITAGSGAGQVTDGESDAPRRSRTPNLLIRSQSLKGAHKSKYGPIKNKAKPHTDRNAPERADTMRGRVRGVSRATPDEKQP